MQHVLASPTVSISTAAHSFGIPKSTAHGIIQRYANTNQVAYKKRGGSRNKKLTNEGYQMLLDWVDNGPDSTLKTLKERLQITLGIDVSIKAISIALTKGGFTLKLIRAIPERRNTQETIDARKAYAMKFMSEAPIDRRQVIWIDETGFNLHLRRKYGRALAGLRANIVVANSRGRNISICAAMSEEGALTHTAQMGSYNAQLFCAFLETLFLHLQSIGRAGCWLIMDNVRFHHCASVRELVAQSGHQLIFLPPYSPMLNPIESLFGKWKTSMRTRGVTFSTEALLSLIELAHRDISVTDCLGWIRDVNRNLAASLLSQPFID